MTKILIGVDGSDRSYDAVAFGRALALAAGAPVIVATAHPPEPRQPRHGVHADHTDCETRLSDSSRAPRSPCTTSPTSSCSRSPTSRPPGRSSRPPGTQAGLIVVGSSHVGRLGRVRPGSTAERLLHGAPCPVAVVPRGFEIHGLPTNPVIGCAYQPSQDGAAALGAAEELTLALSGSLRVMQVVEPPSYLYDTGEMPLNMPEIDARVRADHERALAERVERLSFRLHDVEGTLHVGRAADVLIGLSETVDVMVVGSRGYGLLKAVLLGGVSVR